MGELRVQLEIEVALTNLDPDGTTTAMLGQLAQCASYRALPPDDLPWQVQGGDLRKGAFRILSRVTSPDEPQAIEARGAYETLWTTISSAPPIADLCALQSAELTRDRVRDLVEDLRLRRYLGPATCQWCPGARPERRRTTAR
jgi:hypothetical protein